MYCIKLCHLPKDLKIEIATLEVKGSKPNKNKMKNSIKIGA